jgi:hypothetical protein
LDSLQALQKKCGASEQNETKRYLDKNETRAQSRSAAATHHTAAFTFQCAGKIDMARVNGGHECEQYFRSDTNAGAQRENTPVDLPRVTDNDAGRGRWKRKYERVAAPIRDCDPTGSRDRRKKQAFREKLLH